MRNVSRGGIVGGSATVVGSGVAVAAGVAVGVAVWAAVCVGVVVGVGVTALVHPVTRNDIAARTTSECNHILDLKIFMEDLHNSSIHSIRSQAVGKC
jgi:hypothetical protein